MHTSSVGCGVSADTDTMAETVTPCRPAVPSVVTTLTVLAAWLMPCRNCCLRARSAGVGCDWSRVPLILSAPGNVLPAGPHPRPAHYHRSLPDLTKGSCSQPGLPPARGRSERPFTLT